MWISDIYKDFDIKNNFNKSVILNDNKKRV